MAGKKKEAQKAKKAENRARNKANRAAKRAKRQETSAPSSGGRVSVKGYSVAAYTRKKRGS